MGWETTGVESHRMSRDSKQLLHAGMSVDENQGLTKEQPLWGGLYSLGKDHGDFQLNDGLGNMKVKEWDHQGDDVRDPRDLDSAEGFQRRLNVVVPARME